MFNPLEYDASGDLVKKYELKEFANNSPTINEKARPVKVELKKPELTEADIKMFLEKAKREGYEEGLKNGYQAGLEKAETDNVPVKQALLEVANNFNRCMDDRDDEVSENLLVLALDIAKAMLKSDVMVNKNAIMPIIREALHQLPAVEKPARLALNTLDAAIVRHHIEDELHASGWIIIEDDSIEQGGCFIETATNQIDASNAKRWTRLCESLHQNNEWHG